MADEDQDGLKIVLSYPQLAAILDGHTVSNMQRLVTRLWGGAQLFWSTAQLIGGVGLLLTPEPTMLTKAGGVILAAHGIDSGVAAGRQIWTGETTEDLTQQAGEKIALGFGASTRAAYWYGVAFDAAVPLGTGIALGAERILAIRGGRLSLAAEEAAGGHTIAKHVGQTEAALRARLAAEPRIPAASTFSSLRVAEETVSDALKANKADIVKWASDPTSRGTKAFAYTAQDAVGSGVIRQTGALQKMTKALVVLRKTQVGQRVYFVLTAYPIP